MRTTSLIALPIITHALLCSTALGQTWAGGNGDWFNGANWVGGVAPWVSPHTTINAGTATIDGPNADAVYFTLGTYGTTGQLSILSNGDLLGQDATIGSGVGSVGTAIIDGGIWRLVGWRKIGGYGTGVITVDNGGYIENSTAWLGFETGSTGRVTLTGSEWVNRESLWVGRYGAGTLDILAGSVVSADWGVYIASETGSTGDVIVDGTGSKLTTTSNIFVGGTNGAGEGTLTIRNRGEATGVTAYAGDAAASTGDIAVSGTGSLLSLSSDLYVGTYGTGTLTIESGGTVSSAWNKIGHDVGSEGTVTVTGAGSEWLTTTWLSVGLSGRGTLDILDGGKVTGGNAAIGDKLTADPAGEGTVTVSDAGSIWSLSSLSVGYQGKGVLDIAAGGKVVSGTGIIGDFSGGEGVVTVSGTGSEWDMGGTLQIGRLGDATLTIADGGKVSADSVYLNGGTLNIGAEAADAPVAAGSLDATALYGSGGTIVFNHTSGYYEFASRITGASTINHLAGTTVLLGNNSYTGATTINGGTLRVDGGTLGSGSAVTIASGAVLDVASDITIGSLAGQGNLTVANGVTVSAGSNNTGTTYAGVATASSVGGAFSLEKLGTGTLTLSGYFGDALTQAKVKNGTLHVAGFLNGQVDVDANGTLGGNGDVLGATQVDGTLALAGMRFSDDLTLGSTATTAYASAAPDVTQVGGDLTLGGTLNANLSSAGYYRLFDVTGNITGAFADTDLTGSLTTATTRVVVGADDVSLIALGSGQSIQFWNGDLTWDATGADWLWDDPDTGYDSAWAGSVGVFGGAGNAITVSGTQGFDTLQFSGSGYSLSGGTLGIDQPTGTINVDIGTSVTIASTIADGNGSALAKVGDGTLVLSGINTYTGGTTLSEGTLSLASDDALGTGALVFDGGKLAASGTRTISNDVIIGVGKTGFIAGNDDLTLSGTISGDGALSKTGTGTLTLSGTNTYTGATLVEEGMLAAAGGLSAASAVTVSSGATLAVLADETIAALGGDGEVLLTSGTVLTLAGSGDSEFAGQFLEDIVGAGLFAKDGTGTLILSGDNTAFAGTAAVYAGTLAVNGQIGGLVSVTDAILKGTGTVGMAAIGTGGTLAPGNSIGTINVTGDLSFATGSTFAVEANAAGQSDKAMVGGVVTIATGANLAVQAQAGTYAADTEYTVLSAAGGISGAFDVTSNLYFLDPTLAQSGNDLILKLTRNNLSVGSAASNPNQSAVAGAIDSLGSGNSVFDAFNSLSEEEAQKLLQQASGESHATSQQVIDQTFAMFSQNLSGRTGGSNSATSGETSALGYVYAPVSGAAVVAITGAITEPQASQAFWLAPAGSRGHVEATPAGSALDWTAGGLTLGYEYATSTGDADILGGVALGYLHSNSNAGPADTAFDGGHAGLYGSWSSGALRLSGTLSAGLGYAQTDRRISAGGLDLTASSSAWSQMFGASMELAYGLPLGEDTTMSPLALIDMGINHRNGATETGAGAFNLEIDETTSGRLNPGLGLEIKQTFDLDTGILTAKASATWQHVLLDAPAQSMAFAGTDAAFTVEGSTADRNRLNLSLGLEFKSDTNLTLFADYAGGITSNSDQHSIRLGAGGQW